MLDRSPFTTPFACLLTAAIAMAPGAPLRAQDVPVPFLVEDLDPGADDREPRLLVARDGYLYGYTEDSQDEPVEMFRTSGTTSGPACRLPVPPGSGWVEDIVFLGDRMLVSLDRMADGHELWISDPELSFLSQIVDLFPGPGNGLADGLDESVVLDDKLYFQGDDGVSGDELWVTDGTLAGTQLVKDIFVGDDSNPQHFLAHDGLIYFRAEDAAGREPWISDGTAAGTQRLADLVPGPASSSPSHFAVLGNQVFFMARNALSTTELWTTDGTPGGTSMVYDLSPVNDIDEMVEHDGRLYFVGRSPITVSALWATDGTAAGTAIVVEQVDGMALNSPSGLTSIPNGLLVRFNSLADNELWITDGTAAGTQLIADLTPGGSSNPGVLTTTADGRALFQVRENVFDSSLWITDGTAANTHKLTNLAPGAVEYSGVSALGTDMGAFFTGRTAALGDELWALGPFTRYGRGSAGSGGFVPRLDVSGDATPGGQLQLDISNGLGGGAAFVFLGFDPAEIPFGLGSSATLLVDLVRVFPIGMLSGSGSLSLPTTVPPVIPPMTVLMQLAVQDAGAASGAGFSTGDAVQVVIQ